jgi:(S)-2-hydroxyglutarate dehydrogenase
VSGTPRYDVVVIGGGIIGIATAHALTERLHGSLAVLEAESALAQHQSGHNSGVIHSGLYYRPGSLKARNCVEGRDLMYRFCEEHGVRHERCGKVVVATSEHELPSLVELEQRGRANGLEGMRRLGPEEIRELEPNVAGIAGLHVPQTGIVDYPRVIELLADEVRAAGGDILLGARVHRVRRMGGDLVLETARGAVTAHNPDSRSSPSGASTTSCGPSGGGSCGIWCTRCPIRRSRFSACISPA